MSGDLSQLLDALINRERLPDVILSSELRAEVERQLVPMFDSGQPVVVWSGINEARGDAVVRSGAGEWRIVYLSSDGEHIDSLHVFQRPAPFHGVASGRAVVVNGPSGSGKSSLLEQLSAHSAAPWVVFDEPVIGTVDQGYLIWREQAEVLHRGFLDGIAAVARRGNYVATSAAGHPQALFDVAFADVPVLRIGLDCDPDTLFARERGRSGRWGGLVAASLDDHRGWTYDARFNTTARSTHEIARLVLDLVEGMAPHP